MTDAIMPGRNPRAAEFKYILTVREAPREASATGAVTRLEDNGRKSLFGANAGCRGTGESGPYDDDIAIGDHS
jgi:hypothetical protein